MAGYDRPNRSIAGSPTKIKLAGALAHVVTHDMALAHPAEADIPEGSAIRIATDLLMQQPNVIEPTCMSDVYNYPLMEAAGYALKPDAKFITLAANARPLGW